MHIHCIGIGGAGMSGLARLLGAKGHRVTGEDAEESPFLDALRAAGIAVEVGPGGRIPEGAQSVVRSAAVPLEHPTMREAARLGLGQRKYAEALPLAGAGLRTLAVAGTHGKTSTTALLAHLLSRAGRDPSFLVGGTVPHLGGSAHAGSGGAFVVEACEYDRSFLHLEPHAAIITNVEADHLDCYGTLQKIVEAFGQFVGRIDRKGLLVIPDGDLSAEEAAIAARCPVERFRLDGDPVTAASPYAWRAEGIRRTARCTSFRLWRGEHDLGRARLRVPGLHNVRNALAAAAVAHAEGLSPDEILAGLETFRTVDRRFQVVREDDALVVVSDYAHHPTEVATVLDAGRQAYRGRRPVVLFQPHQAFRTRVFLDRFVEVLRDAGRVLVAPIYGAREAGKDVPVSAATLAGRIVAAGGDAEALPDLETIPERVGREIRHGDALLVLGAGDIYRSVPALARLRPRRPVAARPSGRVTPLRPSGRATCLAELTSFRIGGPVGDYRRPRTLDELREAVLEAGRRGAPYFCVGGGNNLLPSDEGFDGMVIDLRHLGRIRVSRTHMMVQAGVTLPRAMRLAERLGLSGLEPLAGIPGTIGGAIAMNAGGRHGCIADVVEMVGVVLPDGRVLHRRGADMGFRYRGCETEGGVVFEAVLELVPGERQQIRRRTAEIMRGKRASQPYGVPSAGCIFRNPEGDSAGRLIEAAGLKGHRIGGAMVSMLHANFIVNDRGATASDVRNLIAHVQRTVEERFGVPLQLEVKVVGDDPSPMAAPSTRSTRSARVARVAGPDEPPAEAKAS